MRLSTELYKVTILDIKHNNVFTLLSILYHFEYLHFPIIKESSDSINFIYTRV